MAIGDRSHKNLLVSLAACALLGSCGGESTNPAGPSAPGYAGEWRGTTFQGEPFSFTVSPAQKVTGIAIGYRFSGCSGVETFPTLDLTINASPPFFGHSAGSVPGGRAVSLEVFFQSDRTAFALASFYGPPSCGSTGESGPPFQVAKR